LLVFSVSFYRLFGLEFSTCFQTFLAAEQTGLSPLLVLEHFAVSFLINDSWRRNPGKVGYFGLVLLLKDVKTEDTLSVLTIGQIMDFIMKIAGTVAFVALLSGILLNEYQGVVIAGITVVTALTLIASLLIWSERSVKLLSFFSFGPLKKVTNIVEDVQASTSRLKSELAKALLISIAGWVFVGAQWYFIFLALSPATNTKFSFLFFFLLQAVVSTLAFIPVSLGGAGLQESAIVAILGIPGVGVGYTLALTFGILVRGMSILVDVGFGTFNLRKISLRGILEGKK
ncbi:MAG: flippase-like domain-containing protein, partial [Methanophagales archaeon]|nr:flippase-like domain-containing protein [Methanophagales archaeon]